MDKYKVLIGLEMHCEISTTNTKVFSSAINDYSDLANSNIRPVDMAFPGTLPVVNKEAVKKSLMASMILNCSCPEYLYFERKNYYYPDLPKGYQITQETKPAPVGIYGELKYLCNNKEHTVRINNIHLEEDSGSMEHLSNKSVIDYNRAGVPLLELVTEPDFRSADEAVAFLETMRSIYQYAEISEADTKKGQIRCDVNVSIMDNDKDETNPENWGTKIEIKNVNSFGGVRDAINYEIKRQTSLKETNEYDSMTQQTRRWDEENAQTVFMRDKVDAVDYKYFVDPNIPKIKIDKDWLVEIKNSIPVLPNERRKKYINEYGLSEYDTDILIKDKNVSDYFEECVKLGIYPKDACNWITVNIMGYVNKHFITINDVFITPNMLNTIIENMTKGIISSKQAKDIFNTCLEDKKDPKDLISSENAQISNEDELNNIIDEILNNNQSQVELYKNGRDNLFQYFVGQVMKETKGKANPAKTSELLHEKLD